MEKNRILIIQGNFVPSMVEISTVVLEKQTFNFVNVFLLFRNYQPLETSGALHLNKRECPSPKDALCLEISLVGGGGLLMNFLYFVY